VFFFVQFPFDSTFSSNQQPSPSSHHYHQQQLLLSVSFLAVLLSRETLDYSIGDDDDDDVTVDDAIHPHDVLLL